MIPFVIDDALPQALFDRLQHYTLATEMPWFMGSTSTKGDDHKSFSSVLADSNTTMYELTLNCFIMLNSQHNLSCKELTRMRFGMILRDATQSVNGCHVDWEYPHNTALLYINESDGDTILYKERYDTTSNIDEFEYLNRMYGGQQNLTVEKTISPKPNRLVVFDGNQYHASTTPKNYQTRVALNINYTV
jgi:hypothetical protein